MKPYSHRVTSSVFAFMLLVVSSCDLLAPEDNTHPQPNPLSHDEWVNSIVFTSPQNGWITVARDSGSKSAILRTSDGGYTWLKVLNDSDAHSPLIHFTDEFHGWVTQDSGVILRTTNGGVQWDKHALPNSPRFTLNIHFYDNSRGWATTLDGGVFSTLDGGVNWHLIGRVNNGSFPAIYSNGIRTWFGGSDYYGHVPWLMYLDGTKADFTIVSIEEVGGFIRTIEFIDHRTGFWGGIGGVFLTQDSGMSWTRQSTVNALDLKTIGDSTVWVAGAPRLYESAIYKSTNLGFTWTTGWTMPVDTMVLVNRLFFISSELGWASGLVYDSNDQFTKPIMMNYHAGSWQTQTP